MTTTNAALAALLTILAVGSTAQADITIDAPPSCQGQSLGDACPLPNGGKGQCAPGKHTPTLHCDGWYHAPEPIPSATPSAPPTTPSAAPSATPSAAPPGSGGCSAGADSRGGGLAVVVGGVLLALVAARKRTRRDR